MGWLVTMGITTWSFQAQTWFIARICCYVIVNQIQKFIDKKEKDDGLKINSFDAYIYNGQTMCNN